MLGTAPCASQPWQQDAAGFLDPHLESLESVARHTFIGTRKSSPATSLKADELEEEIQPGEFQLRWEIETTQCPNPYSL